MECPGDVVLGEVVGTVASVPGVLAAGPGQLVRERGDEVVERPGHDGVVVGGDVKGNDADGVTDPFENWADFPPYRNASITVVLTQRELHVEERDPSEDGHDSVGEEERPPSVLVTDVGKSPDVAQVHGVAND